MPDENTNSTVDAYKAIIDFNKTIITISSSVLTGLIAYTIYQKIDLKFLNYVSLALIILAILLSLFGFGNAIRTVKDGISRKGTILMTNLSGFLLIGGIVLILTFNHKEESSIGKILDKIEKSTLTLDKGLSPRNLKSLEFKDEKFLLFYQQDSIQHEVVYSIIKNEIISLK